MAWVSGQQLQDGKYTIEKKLGHGGFGITYLAKDKKGNQFVIKTLKNTDIDSDDFDKFLQDFINEAIKLAKCSHHTHIVKVYECIKEGDIWGMVMEYIKGEELGNLGILSESQALDYIQQIGNALTVVHENGLLHRDVTPKNILVRNNKTEAVLIDFGISRDFTPNLTQTHTTYKTPFYAPPEQYTVRAKRGAFTDVYGLAATLYKVLTGKEPESAISRMMGEPLAPPNELNLNISDRVNKAILQGLELQSEKRPQSVQDWLYILDIPGERVSGFDSSVNQLLSRNLSFKDSKILDENILKLIFSKFTEQSIKAIMLAQKEHRQLKHKFIGSEALLLGLIAEDNGLAAKVLKSMGITLKNARVEVKKIIGEGSYSGTILEMPLTPSAKKVLILSLLTSSKQGSNKIDTEHLLLALLYEGQGVAIRVLNILGVELSALIKILETINQ
ncbi:MAG: hypothetical protein EAZ77_09405 [Nostocales cyanobacterium]|nr:MAG: hypothetical protein EAZ77_09405 [Nostocales cyanobacterium]